MCVISVPKNRFCVDIIQFLLNAIFFYFIEEFYKQKNNN